MTQEAFPISPVFVAGVAANIIRLKKEGRNNFYIAQVVKGVAKNRVGKEKEFLLNEYKRLKKSAKAIA